MGFGSVVLGTVALLVPKAWKPAALLSRWLHCVDEISDRSLANAMPLKQFSALLNASIGLGVTVAANQPFEDYDTLEIGQISSPTQKSHCKQHDLQS